MPTADLIRDLSRAQQQRMADELLRQLSAILRTARRIAGPPSEIGTLSGAQLELVRLIRRRPSLSISDAAHELRVAPNTVSTLSGQLTDAGLIVRRADSIDRRIARLSLAPGFWRKVEASRDRKVVALGDAIAQLSRSDQRRISDALPALIELAESLAKA